MRPKIEYGKSPHLGGVRTVSVAFLKIHHFSFGSNTEEAANKAQQLMLSIQRSVYRFEGSVNKVLSDDKGLSFLCVWGLPPMSHMDDIRRAIGSCLDIIENTKSE